MKPPPKEKVAKRKTAAAGKRLRAGRGERGSQERPLRGLKEKVTSPFPPWLRPWK